MRNCSNENVKRNRTKYVDKYYLHYPNMSKFCSLQNMTSETKSRSGNGGGGGGGGGEWGVQKKEDVEEKKAEED